MLGYSGSPTTGQSPIDLDDSIVCVKRYPSLVLNGHWLNDGEAILSNTGTSASVQLTGDRVPSTIRGGPLEDDEYELKEVHFHWGAENCRGAEHTINGTWFSMEAHAVHWNRKYFNFDECLDHTDGLCVLAYLFLIEPGPCVWNNPQLERITDNLKYIIEPDMETVIPANSLCWMRLATASTRYYTYSGSYNKGKHPGCVTWIVFPIVQRIKNCQLNAFRQLKDRDGERIRSNWRDIQYLRGRKIYMSA